MERLQYISHCNDRFDFVEGIAQALRGGCRWIQLRMKDASEAQIVSIGKQVNDLCRSYGAKFIIDDHVQLVRSVGAVGVHLGKNDMPVDAARAILGKDAIIGATANCYDDIVNAVTLGADYIGLGPFRFTTTKKRLSPVLGLEGYRDIVTRCRQNAISTPIVAIGGITVDDVASLMATGIGGIAVSGAILNADSPSSQTRQFLKLLS